MIENDEKIQTNDNDHIFFVLTTAKKLSLHVRCDVCRPILRWDTCRHTPVTPKYTRTT